MISSPPSGFNDTLNSTFFPEVDTTAEVSRLQDTSEIKEFTEYQCELPIDIKEMPVLSTAKPDSDLIEDAESEVVFVEVNNGKNIIADIEILSDSDEDETQFNVGENNVESIEKREETPTTNINR